MNLLASAISTAMARAVAANPKLFDPKKVERAPDILARDLVKELVRAFKEGEADDADDPAPLEWIPADDRRAKAYANLRAAAGLPKPIAGSSGDIPLPRDANNASVFAFEAIPAPDHWRPVSKAQQTAWHEFFERVLPGANRRLIGDRTPFPWPWPPSKEGKTYDHDTQEEIPAP